MKRGLNKENSLPDPEFGGESSESARAIHYVVQKDTLMTYVSARFAQADPGIVSGSTTERKQMSTKTSFKRIALVAVAALGMGVLTSVSPANAATTLSGKIVATSSATAINKATVEAATTSTLSAPAAFTAVGGSTVRVSADMDTYAAVTATIGTNADFSTGQASLTVTSAALETTEAEVTFTAPSTAGTYYVLFASTTGNAWLTLTVRNLGAKLGDGFSSTAGTATVASATSATLNAVAGPANVVTLSATRTAASGLGGVVTITGGSSVIKTIGTGGTIAADKLSAEIANNSLSAIDVVLTTPAAGTITANFYAETTAGSGIYSATATSTVTITVNAAALTNVYNAAKSTFYANTGGSAGTEANNTTYSAAGALSAAAAIDVNTEVANVTVVQKDAAGNNLTSGFKTVSATITGAGLLSTGSSATGASVSSSAAASTTVAAYANGTVGKGVMTVSVDGVVVKTLTITFYGAVKTLTATVKKSNVPVSTTNAAAVINVLATDSLGQPVADTPTITSATGTVISSGTCAASNPATPVEAVCTVTSTATPGSSVLTITASGDTTVKTTVTINVTRATANTAVLTTDKTSYAPGAEATLTLTLTDADGKPVGSADYTSAIAAGGLSISSPVTTKLAFNATDTTITVLDGKATVKFYVPITPGPVTISGTLAAGGVGGSTAKVITPVTFTVTDSASMQALTTLINSLVAKINALSKLVAKIQKKVKA
jgi:trimeric autotransporter adhesin